MQKLFLYMMKIFNFRGDLTDFSAKKAAYRMLGLTFELGSAKQNEALMYISTLVGMDCHQTGMMSTYLSSLDTKNNKCDYECCFQSLRPHVAFQQ